MNNKTKISSAILLLILTNLSYAQGSLSYEQKIINMNTAIVNNNIDSVNKKQAQLIAPTVAIQGTSTNWDSTTVLPGATIYGSNLITNIPPTIFQLSSTNPHGPNDPGTTASPENGICNTNWNGATFPYNPTITEADYRDMIVKMGCERGTVTNYLLSGPTIGVPATSTDTIGTITWQCTGTLGGSSVGCLAHLINPPPSTGGPNGGIGEIGNNINTQGVITLGNSITNNIEIAYDRDWFKIYLIAGTTYTIRMQGAPTNQGTLPDTYIYGVYNSSGTYLGSANDDIVSGNLNSLSIFTAPYSDYFFISAGAYSNKVGTYTLSIN